MNWGLVSLPHREAWRLGEEGMITARAGLRKEPEKSRACGPGQVHLLTEEAGPQLSHWLPLWSGQATGLSGSRRSPLK